MTHTWYNFKCYTVGYGALFVSSADVFNSISLLGKAPLITADSRPADCVATSASDKGRFVMTDFYHGRPCKKCGETKKYSSSRSCVKCVRERARRASKNNPEKREYERQWRATNPDKVRAYQRKYRENNKLKIQRYNRWYREQYPEKRRKTCLRWYKNNPDIVRRISRRQARRRRARVASAEGDFTSEEFRALCDHYGNKCLCCGREDIELTADHVVPLSWEGSTNTIENIQPLCMECNAAKGNRHATDYRTKFDLQVND